MDLTTILGKTINSTKELRNEINSLKDSLVSMEQGGAEWQETATKLTAAQERLTSITQAGKTSVDAAEDSIVGLERQYKALYNTYKLLTEEQRNSDFGKNMGKSLEQLSTKLNDTKKDVGNFKDNIGRYTEGAMGAFNQLGISVGALQGPMKLATMGTQGLSTALKALIANPVGAIIMAIVVAFKAMKAVVDNVKEAINNNEEAQMALSVAMSAFQPVLDKISNMWDALGLKVVEAINVIGKAFRKIRELKGQFTDFLGITDGAADRIREENKLYQELAETQNRITKEKREQSVLNEEDRARAKELEEEAAATTNQAEKLKKLKEAKEILDKVNERSIKLAEEELKLLKEKAKLTANSAADNDAIAAKEREVNSLRREGATQAKKLTSQITALTTATQKQAKATTELTDEEKQQISTFAQKYAEVENWSKGNVKVLEEEYESYKTLYEKMEGVRKEDLDKLKAYYDKKIKEAKEAAKREKDAERENRLLKPHGEIQRDINKGQLQTDAYLYQNISETETDRISEATMAADNEKYYKEWLEKKAELLDAELSLEMVNAEQRLELEREYWAVKAELRDMDYQKALQLQEFENQNKEATENMISNIGSLASDIGGLTSTIISLTQAEIQNGNLSEKELKKKIKNLKTLEAIQLAVAVAAVAADTAAGIMGIWRGYALEKVSNAETAIAAGPAAAAVLAGLNAKSLASAILNTTGIAVAGASQIAAAAGGYVANVRAINEMSAGGADANSVMPTQIDSSSYSYTRQLQTDEEIEELNRPIVVQVVDIENALNKVSVIEDEITF